MPGAESVSSLIRVTHQMKLREEPFRAIESGAKTMEMRLNDEKRSKITVNDIIEFTHISTGEKIKCAVVGIYKYKDFAELYKKHDKISIGYKENEIADPDDMLEFYTSEDIKKYGVIGIEVKKIC